MRNAGVIKRRCRASACAPGDPASATAVGRCRHTSTAKLGPESANTGPRRAGSVSSSSSEMSRSFSGSMPLVAVTSGTPAGRWGASEAATLAAAWDGTTKTTSVTPSTASASDVVRSEEHTSELQSRLHLVCRLLLEKKKKDNAYIRSITLV